MYPSAGTDGRPTNDRSVRGHSAATAGIKLVTIGTIAKAAPRTYRLSALVRLFTTPHIWHLASGRQTSSQGQETGRRPFNPAAAHWSDVW